jgi:hypothetical protein
VRDRQRFPACSFPPSCHPAFLTQVSTRKLSGHPPIARTVESYCPLSCFIPVIARAYIPNCYISLPSEPDSCTCHTQNTSPNQLANAPTSQSCLCEFVNSCLCMAIYPSCSYTSQASGSLHKIQGLQAAQHSRSPMAQQDHPEASALAVDRLA